MNDPTPAPASTTTIHVVAMIWAQQRSGTLLIPHHKQRKAIRFGAGGVLQLEDCMHLNAHAWVEGAWFHEHDTTGHSSHKAVIQLLLSRGRGMPAPLPRLRDALMVRFPLERIEQEVDGALIALLRARPTFQIQDILDQLSPAGRTDLITLISLHLIAPLAHPIWQPATTPPPAGHPAGPRALTSTQLDVRIWQQAQDPRWRIAEELLASLASPDELALTLALRACLILRDTEQTVSSRLQHSRRLIVLTKSLRPTGQALAVLKEAAGLHRRAQRHRETSER